MQGPLVAGQMPSGGVPTQLAYYKVEVQLGLAFHRVFSNLQASTWEGFTLCCFLEGLYDVKRHNCQMLCDRHRMNRLL